MLWDNEILNSIPEPSSIQHFFFNYELEISIQTIVLLSKNYRLIVAPRKFDVLKTNIFPRSEASRANMLVFKNIKFPRGNYQIDSSETNTLLSLFFTTYNRKERV